MMKVCAHSDGAHNCGAPSPYLIQTALPQAAVCTFTGIGFTCSALGNFTSSTPSL